MAGRASLVVMGVHVIKLCCNGCGSDLQVTDDVRFLTCNYCQSKLEVVREVSATHTRVLEKIEKTTDRMAGNLRVIELQNDLERVDREWEAFRQGMLEHGEHGSVSEPSGVAVVFQAIILIVGGIGFFIFTDRFSFPGHFPLFGFLIAGVGAVRLVVGLSRASEFENEKQRHAEIRQELIDRIESERQPLENGQWTPYLQEEEKAMIHRFKRGGRPAR